MPVPDERFLQEGRFAGQSQFVTWSAGWRWVLPATIPNPELSWEIMKFLSTEPGHLANAKGEFALAQEEGDIYVPRLTGHIQSDRMLAMEYLQYLPDEIAELQWFFIEMLEVTHSRPQSPLQDQIMKALSDAATQAVRKQVDPASALSNAQRVTQAALDEYYAKAE